MEGSSDNASRVGKAYVPTAHGLVHLRYAGSGPPVVLLHDSPRSSVLHLPLLEHFQDEFTVFALDTPGYGRSDPLPSQPRPEIPDFSAALAQVLDALGLTRPTVYAYHTSSKIALDCAVNHPGRIGHLVIDGISLPKEPTPEAFIAAYMNPFELDSSGAYIASHWTKVRDLHRFFPWFARAFAQRTPFDEPAPGALHEYALDYFMAGPHYSSGYSAAMRYQALPVLSNLQTRASFIARADDVLLPYLDVVAAHLPPRSTVERLPKSRRTWLQRLRAVFRAASAGGAVCPDGWRERLERTERRYVTSSQGNTHLIDTGRGSGVPVLLLAEPPGGARSRRASIELFAASRRVVAPDWPGCGGSDAFVLPERGEQWAAWIEQVADLVQFGKLDVVAYGIAGALAVAFAARAPDRVRKLVIDGLPVLDAAERMRLRKRYCPRLRVARDGSHFFAMFHRLRDEQLQWPWFDTRAGAARRIAPELDPATLHDRLIDSLVSPDHYPDACTAALSIDVLEKASQVRAATLVLDIAGDPAYARIDELVCRIRSAQRHEADGERRARDAIVRDFLDRPEGTHA